MFFAIEVIKKHESISGQMFLQAASSKSTSLVAVLAGSGIKFLAGCVVLRAVCAG